MGRRVALGSLIAALFVGAVPAHATFPGTNGRIAFVSDRDGDFDVYSMNPDGSDPIPLTATSGDERNPSWSPEGRRIAYDRNAYVHVLADDGSYDVRIETCFYDSQPSWSPDGSRHVLYRQFGKTPYLLTRQIDGTNEDQLEGASIGVWSPEWSPEGTTIAFVNERYGIDDKFYSGIWLMDADGSNPREVTASENMDASPSWHPNSQRLAFTSERDGQLEIYSVDSDGTDLVRLTEHGASDLDPSWSPDGTQIAFISNRDGDHEVFVMDADGSGVRQVTNNGFQEADVDWGVATSDPLPPPAGGASADCVESVDRTISLRLKGHLRAVGRYEVQDEDSQCSFDLRIQRRVRGAWRNVADTWEFVDGRYVARLPDDTGRYRAKVPRTTRGFYMDRYRDVCRSAVSEVKVHRH